MSLFLNYHLCECAQEIAKSTSKFPLCHKKILLRLFFVYVYTVFQLLCYSIWRACENHQCGSRASGNSHEELRGEPHLGDLQLCFDEILQGASDTHQASGRRCLGGPIHCTWYFKAYSYWGCLTLSQFVSFLYFYILYGDLQQQKSDLWCWSCFFQICLNAQIVKPHFNPFFTTEDVLTANYHSTVKAELFEGETCEEAPVLLLEVRKRGEENLPKRAWV